MENANAGNNGETCVNILDHHSRRQSLVHPFIQINRPVFRSKDFYTEKGKCKSFSFNPKYLFHFKRWHEYLTRMLSLLCTYLPILYWFPRYSVRRSLASDLLAALTLATWNISDGLAFGWLAGLTPMHGLYMSIFPVLIYAIFGRSKNLSIGTFPIVSIVCHHMLEAFQASPLSNDFPTNHSNETIFDKEDQKNAKAAVQILTSLGLLVGVIQLLVGLFQLEALFSLLSDTILSAFMTAVPIHIMINQIFPLFGIGRSDSSPVPGTQNLQTLKFVKSCTRFIMQFTTKFNGTTALFSLGTLAILFSWKFLLEPIIKRRFCSFRTITIPLDFILVVVSAIAFSYLKKQPVATIALTALSDSPLYIEPTVPDISLWPSLLPNAFLITFVTFSGAYSTGRVHAKEHGYQLKGSHEMIALGVANVFSSFFHCYPCAVSSTRSSIQSNVDQKTQMASLLSVILVGLFAHFALRHMTSIPVFVLSGIIVTSTVNLVYNKAKETLSILKTNCKSESIVWIGTFLAILLFSTRIGLIFGILLSLLLILFKLIRPPLNIKNAIPDSECYIYKEAATYPQIINSGVLVFEIAGPLIYLSVEHLRHQFRKTIIETIKYNRQRNESIFTVNSLCKLKLNGDFDSSAHLSSHTYLQTTIHSVILDCSSLPFIDQKGVKLLIEFEYELTQTAPSVKLLLANCNHAVFKNLKRFEFFDKFEINRCFISVHDAATASNNSPVTYFK